MVDKALLAKKVAAIRDASERVRAVLPSSAAEFSADRTAREVVLLNLFTAIQESIALAAHWLADEGWEVPQSYGEIFLTLAEHRVIERQLALAMRSAAGLRNLIAHQYGVLDSDRVFEFASSGLGDFVSFCQQIARQSETK